MDIKKQTKKQHELAATLIDTLKIISPDIEVLGQYKAAKKPIRCKCKICGHEWEPTPSNLKKGRGCPKCRGKYHRSEEEFIAEVEKRNSSIEVLGTYVDLRSRIKVKCKNCGKQWTPIAQSILSGYSCRDCAKKKISEKNSLTSEEIYRRMREAHPEITILDPYINANTSVKCRCTVCGYEWQAKGKSLQQGKGCPSCSHQLSMAHEEFAKIIADLSPSIEILGKYKNRKTRVTCRCKNCGYIWNPTGDNLLAGNKCSKCADKARDERILASRKSHKQFVTEMKKINPYIEVLGTYVNSTTPILVHCLHCNHSWEAQPPKLLSGNGCPECSTSSTSFMEKMILEAFRKIMGKDAVISRDTSIVGYELDIYIPTLSIAIEPGSWFWHKDKIDHDRKKREECAKKGIKLITIYDVYDDEQPPFSSDCYTVKVDLGQEKNHETLKTIIEDLFSLCKLECRYSPEIWNEIENCAYISSRKINTEEFRKRMKEINQTIEVLGEYKSYNETIHCRCNKCGYEWDPLVSVLIFNKSGCPKCAGNMKRTHEEFMQILSKKNPSIIVLGQYINSQTSLEVQCKECGNIWSVRPNNLLNKKGCPACAKKRSFIKQRKTHNQFMLEMAEKGNPSIEVMGMYVNANTKILCHCKKCSYEWSAYPTSLLRGHGCKKCAALALRGKKKTRHKQG